MKAPRRAIVLAAGYGTRLQPLTSLKPKPLFPLWNKPVLGHILDLLERWGVHEVVVNAHHHADQILDYLRTRPAGTLRCSLSFEPDILGTGGAIAKARWFVGDDPFWMINADIMADLPCEPLIEAHHRHHALATLWLTPERGPRTVEHRNGLITNFRSTRAGSPGTATFCGLQLLQPGILRHLPPSGFSSIVAAYERAMAAGDTLCGVVVPSSYWADIGTPESYLETHREMMLDRRWRQEPLAGKTFIASGTGTRIHPRAHVSQSVLWDHVTVEAGARVEHAIIADNVRINCTTRYMALPAEQLPDPVIHRVLAALQWNARSTTVMPLPPRGSARTFTRLVCQPPADRGRRAATSSAILVRYLMERPENALYTRHARFLEKHGVSVPSILLDWPSEQVCVMEDAGDDSLDQLVPGLRPDAIRPLYRKTLETVARLHTRATRAAQRHSLELSKPFTRSLYDWEQVLFCEQLLNRHKALDHATRDAIRRELAALIPAQLRAPRVLVHRDLQSSNVLVKDGRIHLIDFQGMRWGTAAYDLASLLCDPYVNLEESLKAELLDYYLDLVPEDRTTRDLFWIAAVERLAQALGAFGRLGAVPATSYFLKHIPPGVSQLRIALAHLPGLPTLKRCLEP